MAAQPIQQPGHRLRVGYPIHHDLTGAVSATQSPPPDLPRRIAPLQSAHVLAGLYWTLANDASLFYFTEPTRFFFIAARSLSIPPHTVHFLTALRVDPP